MPSYDELLHQSLQVPSFRGHLEFCSNMFLIQVFGYPSAEHAYVAAKTLDKSARERIKRIESPYAVKRFGRTLILRPDWDSKKLDIMYLILNRKFSYPGLAQKLIETDDIMLVERNNWRDTFWGECNGRGENNLGKLLMQIRASL